MHHAPATARVPRVCTLVPFIYVIITYVLWAWLRDKRRCACFLFEVPDLHGCSAIGTYTTFTLGTVPLYRSRTVHGTVPDPVYTTAPREFFLEPLCTWSFSRIFLTVNCACSDKRKGWACMSAHAQIAFRQTGYQRTRHGDVYVPSPYVFPTG